MPCFIFCADGVLENSMFLTYRGDKSRERYQYIKKIWPVNFSLLLFFIYKKIPQENMTEIDDTTWHIYAKDRCLYHNLTEEEFEEKWQLLQVMVDLISSDYSQEDLSYERLAPKVGLGGPGKLLPVDEEHSY